MRLLSLRNPFAGAIYHEETLSSTFDAARVLAKRGEPHGTVITADFQEAGKGRHNRPWKTEPGKNLLFTILLNYEDFSLIPQALTLRTGLAVSLAIEDLAPALTGFVKVKWPNDVMIDSGKATGKMQAACKAAGILTETDGNNVLIGIGVNVAQREFPEEYRSRAISIIQVMPELQENARFILLEKILCRLHEEIEKSPEETLSGELEKFTGGEEPWQKALLGRLYKLGETVNFAEGPADSDRIITGTLSGINSRGELLIIPEGEDKERAFITGELRLG